jgi:hypothetical protein
MREIVFSDNIISPITNNYFNPSLLNLVYVVFQEWKMSFLTVYDIEKSLSYRKTLLGGLEYRTGKR